LGEDLNKSGANRRSLKKYELTNLLFFLTLIIALGILVTVVFRHYGTRNTGTPDESEAGVISDQLNPDSDVGMFYLGTKLTESSRLYRNMTDIPVTDDGLVRDLFNLPGVEEVTIDQRMLIVKKTNGTRWEGIQPGVRQIVKNHLHLHY
jgi:hypothetical protein